MKRLIVFIAAIFLISSAAPALAKKVVSFGKKYKEVTQAEAEAGTDTKFQIWSAERVKQAIIALAPASSFDPASPGTIGGTTPGAGTFTTLTGSTVNMSTAVLGPATGKFYKVSALTGGGAGSLDSIPIADLADGSVALYTVDDGGSKLFIVYQFDAEATDAESSPGKIRPDDYATAGVWISSGLGGQGVPTYRARASFNPHNVYDNDGTNHWLTLEPRAPAAVTITRLYVSLDVDPTTELTVTFKECDAGIGCANPSTIEAVTTDAGVANVTASIDDAAIAAGKKIIIVLSDPDVAILTADVLLEGTY